MLTLFKKKKKDNTFDTKYSIIQVKKIEYQQVEFNKLVTGNWLQKSAKQYHHRPFRKFFSEIALFLDKHFALTLRMRIISYYDCTYRFAAAAAAKSLQSCPTLCDPIDGSPPGSPVPGILQTTTLEWVAISFSNAGKWKVKVKSLTRVQLFATPWTAAYQAPPSMGFSRQEYWSGVPLPSPTYLFRLPKMWRHEKVT